ncbi:PREDICTED: uncharacterized protein LOC104791130 [Camelina sativa]|uniref:Uncharacterized protein LOC104791130 n=1 Tax=Camelina sativa TaxID=90675 RepID=A0ABM0ZG29_CAMSA|nr:PREDICTED: uncharacterized protein LOC104791130 [Camelina sativa]
MMRYRLAFWYLVLALLSDSSAYSNSGEVCELMRFTMNMEESTRVPKLIFLQWDSINQEVRLSARGGCANAYRHYKWFSSDSRTVSVTPYGVIRGKRPGVANVKVVSFCDPQNYDLVVVKVFGIQDMCYDMDDMKANLNSMLSKPSIFKFTLLEYLMFPFAVLIGNLIYVFYPVKPRIEPCCSSTTHNDQDCRRTKRIRRTILTTIMVKKKIYRRRWLFRPYMISRIVHSPVG